jgi:hypothetical protein
VVGWGGVGGGVAFSGRDLPASAWQLKTVTASSPSCWQISTKLHGGMSQKTSANFAKLRCHPGVLFKRRMARSEFHIAYYKF